MIRYPSIISLPNLRLYFHQDIFAEEYFMVAGGRTPELSWLKAAAAGRTLYCVDHGADACRAAGLSPSFFIGDGDSAGEDTLKWLQSSNAEIRRYPPEKDKTDTQLALELVAKKKDDFVILSGCFGGRFDHLFSLLYSFVGSSVRGCLADEREFLFVLRGGESVEIELDAVPQSVSLLPLSLECTGVSLSGVHWPLSGAVLRQDNPYAVSNRLASAENRIKAENGSGILAFYLCWNESGI